MAAKNYSSIHHVIKKVHKPAPQQVSSGSPESPHISEAPKSGEIQEVVELEKLDPAVSAHVEVRPETPKVPEDLKKIGVQPVSSPVFTDTQGAKLPLTPDEMPKALSAPVDSSLRWLGVFTMYLLERSHSSIKTVHRGLRGLFRKY